MLQMDTYAEKEIWGHLFDFSSRKASAHPEKSWDFLIRQRVSSKPFFRREIVRKQDLWGICFDTEDKKRLIAKLIRFDWK